MSNIREEFNLLTLEETAALLQISKRTLLRLLWQWKMPAFKVGGRWRIRASQLRKWVEHKENGISNLK